MYLRSLAIATMVLISEPSITVRGDTLKDRIVAEYAGEYVCNQGASSLTIQLLKPKPGSLVVAIFKFGPTSTNSWVSSGAFLLRGTVSLDGGRLELQPLSWLSRPFGYDMVGLSGNSIDGGITFTGFVDGTNCSAFSISRVSTAATYAPPSTSRSRQQAPQPPSTPSTEVTSQPLAPLSDHLSEIPLQTQSGVFVVPVMINGALTLNFMVDSGAADVSIPADVVLTLIRTGTIQKEDFLGQKTYQLADGSTVPSQTF